MRKWSPGACAFEFCSRPGDVEMLNLPGPPPALRVVRLCARHRKQLDKISPHMRRKEADGP